MANLQDIDGKRFEEHDDNLCMLCGAYGNDKRSGHQLITASSRPYRHRPWRSLTGFLKVAISFPATRVQAQRPC